MEFSDVERACKSFAYEVGNAKINLADFTNDIRNREKVGSFRSQNEKLNMLKNKLSTMRKDLAKKRKIKLQVGDKGNLSSERYAKFANNNHNSGKISDSKSVGTDDDHSDMDKILTPGLSSRLARYKNKTYSVELDNSSVRLTSDEEQNHASVKTRNSQCDLVNPDTKSSKSKDWRKLKEICKI